jgi:hypothetical protein
MQRSRAAMTVLAQATFVIGFDEYRVPIERRQTILAFDLRADLDNAAEWLRLHHPDYLALASALAKLVGWKNASPATQLASGGMTHFRWSEVKSHNRDDAIERASPNWLRPKERPSDWVTKYEASFLA